jgi:hypothetical protein
MHLSMPEAERAVKSYDLPYMAKVVMEMDRDNIHSFEVAAAQRLAHLVSSTIEVVKAA